MVKVDFQDRPLKCLNGFLTMSVLVAFLFMLLYSFYNANFTFSLVGGVIFILIIAILPSSIFINSPNEAKVFEFFGQYIGTVEKSGFFFSIPFVNRRNISLKMNNISTEIIKVNDFNGNPIEISAVIVWKVLSPVKACFNVSNYREFVEVQSETALRELAGAYPYDDEEHKESLKKNSKQISLQMINILRIRLEVSGIGVEDAKISHLAYSPEIAKAMLKKQQAQAIVSARIYIVRNAVNMVEEVLTHFEQSNQIQLGLQQKINLINNLLVTLLSEQGVQPTITIE